MARKRNNFGCGDGHVHVPSNVVGEREETKKNGDGYLNMWISKFFLMVVDLGDERD